METIDPIPTQTKANAREVGVAPIWSRMLGTRDSEEAMTRPLPMNITATASGEPGNEDFSVCFAIRIFCLRLWQIFCYSIGGDRTSPKLIRKFRHSHCERCRGDAVDERYSETTGW